MATTKKDKDPSRAERKLKKRKLEEAIPDLPGDVGATNLQDASISLPTMDDGEHSTKKRKLAKSSNHDIGFLHGGECGTQQKKSKGKKKGKRTLNESMAILDGTENLNGRASGSKLESLHGSLKREPENLANSAPPIDDVLPAKKTKKERKAERKVAEAAQVAARNESAPPPTEDAPVVGEGETPMGKSKKNNRNREKKRKGINGNEILEKAEGKPSRFIVFIGNLPFSATTGSIQKHFAAVHPKFIRHLTKKDEPEKSKGYAFIEFEGYDHMKACLKSFHHSTFDDGISLPRKINVELTAGGGGNKQNRHTKISEKNQKLNEQRVRRMHEDEKAKLMKRDLAIDHSDVHPSRRARVPDIS